MKESEFYEAMDSHPELYSRFEVINSRITFVVCWSRDEGYYLSDGTHHLRIPIQDEKMAEELIAASQRLYEEERKESQMHKIFFHETGFFSLDSVVNVNYLDASHQVTRVKQGIPLIDQVNGIEISYIHIHIGQGLFVLLGWEEGKEFLRRIKVL